VISAAVRPRGPYSLRATLRHGSDATRTNVDGVLVAALASGGAGRAWQQADGVVQLRAPHDAGIDELRFVLALDDDHSEFLRRFARDPLIGAATRRVRGLRPLRTATVAQSLLRALAGQLIQARRARQIEQTIVTSLMPRLDGTRLHLPPDCATLGRVSPAELRRLGLGMRRGAALVRICRSLDLERLRSLPGQASAERLQRERGLGPWSVGVVSLEGLGRYDRGLVADLGLVKLQSALKGRWVETWETAELLEPYGEWAGLASVYLLQAHALGLIDVPKTAAA
jgi:3-methyladenine DNA glycosylase/8-oxoguanine DNA glycosylase